MSADNWATCPRCWRNAQREFEDEKTAVMALYGQIPVEEFDAKRGALEAPSEDSYTTFREDYEWYLSADGSEVLGVYSGGCSTCGLNVEHQTSKRFWSPDAA